MLVLKALVTQSVLLWESGIRGSMLTWLVRTIGLKKAFGRCLCSIAGTLERRDPLEPKTPKP